MRFRVCHATGFMCGRYRGCSEFVLEVRLAAGQARRCNGRQALVWACGRQREELGPPTHLGPQQVDVRNAVLDILVGTRDETEAAVEALEVALRADADGLRAEAAFTSLDAAGHEQASRSVEAALGLLKALCDEGLDRVGGACHDRLGRFISSEA